MFRNNHPEARRQQQPVTPHPPGGQVQEQGPGQRRDITIDWADRLIHPRRDTRLNGKWEGLKATLRSTALCRRTRHKVAQHHRRPHHHSVPRLHGGPSASGAQDSALLASRCSCNHSACAAGSGQHRSSISIRRQRAPSSRSCQQANGCTSCACAVRVFISPVQLMQPHQALHLATNFSA
jgi:hypothetical protein